MLDEVAGLVWRVPASRALGAAGDRAVSPEDQAAPSASSHQESPGQQRGSRHSPERLKRAKVAVPMQGGTLLVVGHGGKMVSQPWE